MNLSPQLNVAIRAARSAGLEAMKHFHRRYELTIQNKNGNDFVTAADHAVERELIHQLERAYPKYGFHAEESGIKGPDSAWKWIIDPIDGTTNFIHGLSHFAISIALAHEEELQSAVVFNPATDELFFAERGRGTFLNDQRLRVVPNNLLNQCLLATGFPVNKPMAAHTHLKAVEQLLLQSRGIRRMGSAALDLAFVAAGRYDGFWEPTLSPWDIAAGVLLVTEAGGMVSDFDGKNQFMRSGNILAASPAIHPLMLSIITPTWQPTT